MRKLVFGLSVGAVLALAGPASAQSLVKVPDPTPTGTFTGEYACYDYVAETETDPGEYDANGNPGDTHNRVDDTCTQEGYVSVGPDGVVACNGNPDLQRPDDGSPLVGYVWVGPAYDSDNDTFTAPGGVAGAGNNHEDADGNATGEAPCPND